MFMQKHTHPVSWKAKVMADYFTEKPPLSAILKKRQSLLHSMICTVTFVTAIKEYSAVYVYIILIIPLR